MLKKLNTILFIAELVFIGAPITLLAMFGAVLTVPGVPGANTDYLSIKQLAMLTAFVGLYGFWGMSIAFAHGGVERVRRTSWGVRIAAAVGVLMSLSSVLYGRSPQADAFFAIAFSGTPLLIPLAHILVCIVKDKAMRERREQRDAVTG